jgi:aryl-alcohol dehydrogenase-like predicted oxidoreductase
MELRTLGRSDLELSVFAFGTATFGGTSDIAKMVGGVGLQDAIRLTSVCLEAGVNLFDTADSYSDGAAETILGQALGSRRNGVMIATKASARTGPGEDDVGSSRAHLIRACEASLKRLRTDRIDLYQLHAFDALTPLEETARALEELVHSGKVRYVGCSNFAGWQLMKALWVADQIRTARFVSHQIYYSMVGRDAEHDLIPAALDQGLGILVWGPLASGLLSGKFARGQPFAYGTRLGVGVPGSAEMHDAGNAFDVLDVARDIAATRRVPVSQVALNWLLWKPGVTSILIGARNELQLRENLDAISWELDDIEFERLDLAGKPRLPYPQWIQRSVYQSERNPTPRARLPGRIP